MARLRLVDAGAPAPPELPAIEYTPEDELGTLENALVAVRRASSVPRLAPSASRSLETTTELLEMLCDRGRRYR